VGVFFLNTVYMITSDMDMHYFSVMNYMQ